MISYIRNIYYGKCLSMKVCIKVFIRLGIHILYGQSLSYYYESFSYLYVHMNSRRIKYRTEGINWIARSAIHNERNGTFL